MASVRGAHLVGSLTYPDAESAMIAAAENLGGLLRRIPDGEPGDRFHWIMFQPDVLARAEGIERVGDEPIMIGHLDGRPLRIAEGVDATGIRLPDLGYARAATESYEVFRRLRAEGVIAPGTRFQVALPTPTAVIGAFFSGDDRQAIEPVYRDLVYRELDGVLAAVPHDDLAIQWDCAVEFAVIETHAYPGGSTPWWPGDVWQGLVDRAAETARENLTEARCFVRALAPADLAEHSLAAALLRQVERVREHGVDADLRVAGTASSLSLATEAALLRIAQSALANVVQHADATRVDVGLTFADDEVRLDIVDDGVGFDPDAASVGFGLPGMASRVRELGGRFAVESSAGDGTAVAVVLPVEQEGGR